MYLDILQRQKCIDFRFPKNLERWESWRTALNLNKEDIFPRSMVCHLHFRQECYDRMKSPFALHLKQDAIPIEVNITKI